MALRVITAAVSDAGYEGAIEDLTCMRLAEALAYPKTGLSCSKCGPAHHPRTCADCDDCVEFALYAITDGI